MTVGTLLFALWIGNLIGASIFRGFWKDEWYEVFSSAVDVGCAYVVAYVFMRIYGLA